MKFAIIDLGSNSARMNIVQIKDGKAEILETHRKIVRLSEGMGEEKLLREVAVNRTLAVMAEFKKIIDEHDITKVRPIATAALRTAKNRELFLKPASEIGFDFEIISGEKEAYYDYMAVVNSLDVTDGLAIDIGGASTELILIKGGQLVDAVSIPMAAVNITEKYFSGTVATDEELKNAIDAFAKELNKTKWLENARNISIVGLGGTIRALANIHCKVDELHSYVMSRNFVLENAVKLTKMPLEQRLLIDGLEKGRADIILGGVVPLIAVMQKLDSPDLVTCVTGLREGVMYDIIKG